MLNPRTSHNEARFWSLVNFRNCFMYKILTPGIELGIRYDVTVVADGSYVLVQSVPVV